MKGEVVTNIPAELHSVAAEHIVVSSEEVYDYIQQKRQEDINKEIINKQTQNDTKVDLKVAEVEKDMATLKSNVETTMRNTKSEIKTMTDNVEEHLDSVDELILKMKQDNASTKEAIQALSPDQQGALALSGQVQDNTEDISKVKSQLKNYNIVVLSEGDYEQLVEDNETNKDTLYFTTEDEE